MVIQNCHAREMGKRATRVRHYYSLVSEVLRKQLAYGLANNAHIKQPKPVVEKKTAGEQLPKLQKCMKR